MKITKSIVFCLLTFLLAVGAQAQEITVSGKVIDEKGLPIPGVTVLLKGTAKATSTDIEGSYQLKTPANGSLIYSFVGYKTSTEIVNNRSTINVNLQPQAEDLKEVVVTALGIKRQTKALGYATQAVKGETLQTVRGVDVATSLTGKVAGMLVKNSSDFGSAPEIRLRNESKPPLLVIDGVAYDNMTLREVPADDIETINVLKGQTAAALYGDRGTPGAIMVTTKKGLVNKGLSVSFNTSTMLTAGYLAIPKIQSTFGRQIDTSLNRYSTSGDGSWGVPMDGRMVNQWNYATKQWELMPYLPLGKDNFANFVSQGYINNHNFSITQQGENGSVRASVTWVKNQGQYPNSVFDKITYNLGGEMKIDKFTLSSALTYNKQASPNIGFNGYTAYDPMYNLLVWSTPDFDIRTAKDYWIVKDQVQNTSWANTNNNPYFDQNERIHSKDRDVINGNLTFGYDLASWLKATLRIGYDNFNDHQTIRVAQGSLRSAGTGTVIDGSWNGVWGESQLGSYNEGTSRGSSLNNDLLLTGNKKFGDFIFDGLVGASSSFRQTEGIEAFSDGGLLIPGYYSLKSSILPIKVTPYLTRRKINSAYTRLSLSWKNIAFVEGTFRNDWSSTLPVATRSYSYPSLAGSLVLSELLPKSDWLSFWKIRGSWTTAREIADPFVINSTYNLTNSVWGTMSSQSLSATIRPADLKAAGSETFEVGTAMTLLNKRITLDVTYYSKRKYDGILYAPISSSSGYTTGLINSGEQTTQRGYELAMTGLAVKEANWQWDLGLNASTAAKYYTKLDTNPLFAANLNYSWYKVGQRADPFLIQQLQKDPQGNVIYNNGLPQFEPFLSRIGYADPKIVWGITSNLKYKNISLAVSVDGRVGGMAETRTEMYMWISGNHPDSVVPERMLDATTGTANYVGQGVKVVSGTYETNQYGVLSDTRVFTTNDQKVTYQSYIETLHHGTAWGGRPGPFESYSTTFFKIREMALNYNFNKPILDVLHAKALSFSLVAQNLYLKAKDFKYSDPDGGYENFSDPSQRFVGFNIKASF